MNKANARNNLHLLKDFLYYIHLEFYECQTVRYLSLILCLPIYLLCFRKYHHLDYPTVIHIYRYVRGVDVCLVHNRWFSPTKLQGKRAQPTEIMLNFNVDRRTHKIVDPPLGIDQRTSGS